MTGTSPAEDPCPPDDYDWDTIRPDSVDRDFLEAVGFVTLVEANPQAPGAQILAAADRSDAPWLSRFINETWLPEEGMHHVPFKEYLIRSGAFQEAFLDAEIDKVIDRGFSHGAGYTDLQGLHLRLAPGTYNLAFLRLHALLPTLPGHTGQPPPTPSCSKSCRTSQNRRIFTATST